MYNTPLRGNYKANMKNILLCLSTLLCLQACQNTAIKKAPTSSANKQPAMLDDRAEFTDAHALLNSLNQCYENTSCNNQLEAELNNWLLEKNLLTEADEIETDEQNIGQLPKNVTTKNGLVLNNIRLSSNYMNNELIKGALNEWLTWKRPQLINTWQYYQYLRKDMSQTFVKYQIDESLILAIMAQESGGKVHSRSRVGAGGLFQIMPATAKRLGIYGKHGAYDQRFSPQQSAIAAAQYLREQKQLYAGDKAKILAAYNSGENRFARLNRRYNNKSIWDKNFYYELPRETRHYIPVVLAAMLIFQDPAKFNVQLNEVAAEVVAVSLGHKSSLSQLAVCLGQKGRDEGWFRVLRNLNSGIKADKTIAANTELMIPKILLDTFTVNCQNSSLMQLAQSLHEADFKASNELFRYRVKKGDSLDKIARKFRCTSRKEIARLNHLKAPRYLIRAGKHLKIPQC